MQPFHELADRSPRWQPALRWKRHFELRADGLPYATLSWEKASGDLVVARPPEARGSLEGPRRATTRGNGDRGPEAAGERRVHASGTTGGCLVTSGAGGGRSGRTVG